MINPKALHFIIKYFDAVDAAVSARTIRKRPWSETSLTSLLCDLLDEETRGYEQLAYTLADLNKDLQELDGLIQVSLNIETHEYPPSIERFVTQSDLGFIVDFRDYFLPD